MIYNINLEEINNSFNSIFSYFQTIGDLIYSNKNIYLNTTLQKKELLLKTNEIISDEEQIMIIQITKGNLIKFPEQIRSWSKSIYIKEEKIKFEKEQQEALKQYNKFLDDFELELEKQIQDRSENNK